MLLDDHKHATLIQCSTSQLGSYSWVAGQSVGGILTIHMCIYICVYRGGIMDCGLLMICIHSPWKFTFFLFAACKDF